MPADTATADEALSRITQALGPDGRAEVEQRFARTNPGWRGARAADILDLLWQHDAHLDIREPFADANPDLIGADHAASYAVLALIWTGRRVTRDAVTGLLHAAGLLATMGAADVAALGAEVRDLSGRTLAAAETARDLGQLQVQEDLAGFSGWLMILARRFDKAAAEAAAR